MTPELQDILSYLFWIIAFIFVSLIIIGVWMNKFIKNRYPGYDEYSPLHWARTTPRHNLWIKLWQIATMSALFSMMALMMLFDDI